MFLLEGMIFMSADLHMHSIYSDGSYKPQELINQAKMKNIETIALADHDTTDGLDEALQAGKKMNVEVIPAIEFSVSWQDKEPHLLGYFIDYKHQRFQKQIKKIFKKRKERAVKMIEKLKKRGIKLDLTKVKEMSKNDYIGRPHIARQMIEQGYINDMSQAFSKKYIARGGKAYVPRYKISMEKAVELIHQVNGLAVLAHPGHMNGDQPLKEKEIVQLKEIGLDGVEVFHSRHDKQKQNYYQKTVNKLDLLITGGSDFHGTNTPQIEMGDILLPQKYIRHMKQTLQLKD